MIVFGIILLIVTIIVSTIEIIKIFENHRCRYIGDMDGGGFMAETNEVTVYTKEDMMALDNMSSMDVVKAIESLDKGYFNKYLYPEFDDEYKTYSEEEYYDFRIRVALRKVYEHFDDLAEKEEKSC